MDNPPEHTVLDGWLNNAPQYGQVSFPEPVYVPLCGRDLAKTSKDLEMRERDHLDGCPWKRKAIGAERMEDAQLQALKRGGHEPREARSYQGLERVREPMTFRASEGSWCQHPGCVPETISNFNPQLEDNGCEWNRVEEL